MSRDHIFVSFFFLATGADFDMARGIKSYPPISIRKIRNAEMSNPLLLGETQPIYDTRKMSCE